MRKGETLVGDALSRFLCNVNRIPQSKGGGNKKTSPKATDNNRYAGSFVKRNRRRIIVGREDKSALNNIKDIVTRPDFDRNKALQQQIELLELKKEHINNLISMCRGLRLRGTKHMDFTAFDSSKLDEYAKLAKERWGNTPEYKEFEEKDGKRSKSEEESMMADFMKIFEEFGAMKDQDPVSSEVQNQVKKLQSFITEHFYKCTNEILFSLGKMYAGGGEFTENINKMGGEGTAGFIFRAIKIYCE